MGQGSAILSRQRSPLALRPDPQVKVPEVAMVMGAGLGKRMRPLTATRPKPLVQVAGKMLIDYCLDRLETAGVKRAVVNVHYLADALEAHLKGRSGGISITISDERNQLLDTGGGVAKALPMIDADPFLIVNSDILWIDGPIDTLRLLASNWDDERMDALLLLVPLARAYCHGGQGDFHMSATGQIRRKKRGLVAPFVYASIQMVSKRLFAGPLPDGPFSTNLLWDRAIEAGRCFGVAHQGVWSEVGTPPDVKKTEQLLESLQT